MAADGTAGMVAVVRGLQDAGLAVTLYDNGKEFTLAPNTFAHPPIHQGIPGRISLAPQQAIPHLPNQHSVACPRHAVQNIPIRYAPDPRMLGYPELRTTATDATMPSIPSSNAGTQVVDGRYASVYQATYCKVRPTNPPPQVTEFPPQRAVASRGCSNFVVGGTGSGDTRHKPVHIPNNYRGGGLNWPDKDSVCTARPSMHPDAFAKSLRRYPQMSPERSSEIVERLITYTQAKNFGRSPTRQGSRHQCEPLDDRLPKIKVSRGCESPRTCDESPTREKPKRGSSEPLEFKKFYKNFDVRHVREISKGIRDNVSNATCSNCHYSQTASSCRQRSPNSRMSEPQQSYPSMVHSEIQAAVTMVCRQVETVPVIEPPTYNVKVSCSEVEQAAEGQGSYSIQTNVQTTLSTIEIPTDRLVLNARKSRSTEEIGNRYEKQKETLETFEKTFNKEEHLPSKNKKITSLRINNSDGLSETCVRNTTSIQYRNSRAYRRKISKDFSNMKTVETRNYDVFRAEILSCPSSPKDHVIKIVRSWLNKIPLKSHDYLGRLVKKEQILCYVVRRIKMIPPRVQCDKKKFRAEILDIVDDVPFDMGRGNRKIYLKKIAEDLITKLELTRINSASTERSRKLYNNKYVINTANNIKRYSRPSEEEIREFVKRELINAIHKSHLDINTCKARDVEDELVDVLHDIFEDIDISKDKEVMEEIVSTLEDIGQILRFQASYFASMLIDNFRKKFWNEQTINTFNNGIADIPECEYIEHSNEVANQLTSRRNYGTSSMKVNMVNKYCETSCMTENSCRACTQGKQKAYYLSSKIDLDSYTQQLSKKIEQWLNNLESEMPQVRNRTFRKTIIKELVDDIVDRQKYLNFNSERSTSEKDEVEYLRYQIFKWIYKIVGDSSTNTLERAPILMQIIRSIPVPELTKLTQKWKENTNEDYNFQLHSTNNLYHRKSKIEIAPSVFTMTIDQNPATRGNATVDNDEGDQPDVVFTHTQIQYSPKSIIVAAQNTVGRTSLGTSNKSSTSYQAPPPPQIKKTIQEMNIEFMNFVKQWVHSIPIPPNTPQEPEIRQGLLYGVMQAIAKLKASPVIAINPLYYEDALEEELETLFSLLPQSEELLAKKHQLKVQMISTNCDYNEKIKELLAPGTFGQCVKDELSVYIPRTKTNDRDVDQVRLYEELKILFMTEEYIMFLRFREEDKIKANVYKMKLLRHVQEFIRDLKQIHKAELQDINEDVYMEDILAAMERVPIPSDETIKQEADEVMLGMEIDKWFSDLPLAENPDLQEQYRRRRLRDQLARKCYEMEQNINSADETGEQEIRHEVSLVLKKLPLEKDEDLKINFMVDELTNRIKNRQRGPTGRRKSVGFDEAQIAASSSRNNLLNQQYAGTTGPCIVGATGPCIVGTTGPCLIGTENAVLKSPLIQYNSEAKPQTMQQPGILMPQPALPMANMPQTYIPPIQTNAPPPNNVDASQVNASLWLNKAIEGYEAKRPVFDKSIQFGPARPETVHELSQTIGPPAASSSIYQPQTAQSNLNQSPSTTRRGLSQSVPGSSPTPRINEPSWPYSLAHPIPTRAPPQPQLTAIPTQADQQNISRNFAQQSMQPRSMQQQSIDRSLMKRMGDDVSIVQKNATDIQQQSIDQSVMRRMDPGVRVVQQIGPITPEEIEYFTLPESSIPAAILCGPQPHILSQPPSYLQTSEVGRSQHPVLVQTSNPCPAMCTQSPALPQSAQSPITSQAPARPYPTQVSYSQPPILSQAPPALSQSANISCSQPTPVSYSQPPIMSQAPALSQPHIFSQTPGLSQPTPVSYSQPPIMSQAPAVSQPYIFSQTPGLSQPTPASYSQPPLMSQAPALSQPPIFSQTPGLSQPTPVSYSQPFIMSRAPAISQPPIFSQAPGFSQPTAVPCSQRPIMSQAPALSQPAQIAYSQPSILSQAPATSQPAQASFSPRPILSQKPAPLQPAQLSSQSPKLLQSPGTMQSGLLSVNPADQSLKDLSGQEAKISPPHHRTFEADLPLSSSSHLGGPVFERSVNAQRQSSPSPTTGNQSARQVSRGGENIQASGRRSVQIQTPLTSIKSGSGNLSVLSAGHQAPDFYKSTDREGIQLFTEQNKSARILTPIEQQPVVTINTENQRNPTAATQQQTRVDTATAQTSNFAQVQKEQQTNASSVWKWLDGQMAQPIPSPPPGGYKHLGQAPPGTYPYPGLFQPGGNMPPGPVRLGAPEQPKRRFNEDIGDDSDGRCKCFDRIKKMKRMGLCRKCNGELNYAIPMRYYPPCPWYF